MSTSVSAGEELPVSYLLIFLSLAYSVLSVK